MDKDKDQNLTTPQRPGKAVGEPQAVLSTPSGHGGTASRNQSRNPNYTATEIQNDLLVDIGHLEPISIEKMLQYFLYLCMEPKSVQKEELDILLDKIEKMEAKIYKTSVNKSDELKELRNQRDAVLGPLLDACLERVLPICENPALQKHLREYGMGNATKETDRYAPYVAACNCALELLGEPGFLSELSTPIRDKSSLDIRFQRNDPNIIKSEYNKGKPIHRKPDVGTMSKVAAEDAGSTQFEHYQESPTHPIDKWDPILGPIEFKLKKHVIRKSMPENHTVKRNQTFPQDSQDVIGEIYDQDDPSTRAVVPGQVNENAEPDPKRRKLDSESHRSRPSSAPDGDSRDKTTTTKATKSREGSASRGSRASGSRASGSRASGSRASGSRASGSRASGSRASGSRASGSNGGSKGGSAPAPTASTQKISARTQCAMYALEMMSRFGVHHAITSLIVDDKIWVFYYDRQGTIQSDGFNFIDDLPYFLVLLLAFQRFNLENWGFISELNANAALAHDPNVVVPNKQAGTRLKPVDLRNARNQTVPVTLNLDRLSNVTKIRNNLTAVTIDPTKYIFHSHCIKGRATSVIEANAGGSEELVFKIYNPDAERTNEGDIIQDIYSIIDKHDPSMKKHMPEMLAYGDFLGCLTNRIRSMFDVSWEGHRTTRFVILVKLNEFTTLAGEDFMRAWFDVVKFHAFLWRHEIFHGDPSLWNLMCDKYKTGVLSDFDLAVSGRRPRRIGKERTGTIPFMSVMLLTSEYWNGQLERQYYHELEALIWVLPFVFLRYPRKDTIDYQSEVEKWILSNFDACCAWKTRFLHRFPKTIQAAITPDANNDWKVEWRIAFSALKWVKQRLAILEEEAEVHIEGLVPEEREQQESRVETDFLSFIQSLRKAIEPSFIPYLPALLNDLEAVIQST